MATIDDMLAVAVQHHQAGRWYSAELIYQEILAADPAQADAQHLLGLIASQMGKHELAVDYISRAIEINATESPFHSNLGTAFQALGKLDDAVRCFRRALELNADDAAAAYNLGNALQNLGMLHEAVASYLRALQLRPYHAPSQNNLGNVLKSQGKLDDAIACFRRAIELNPNYAEAHKNLGEALEVKGNTDESAASLRRALEQHPDYIELTSLGNTFQNQGEYGDAVACFHRAVAMRPDDPNAHYNLGNAFSGLRQFDAAVSAYLRALELRPYFPECYSNLAVALQSQGKLDQAVTYFREALQLNPRDATAHNNLGLAYLALGKLDDALASFRRTLELKPDYLKAHSNLANTLQQLRRFDDATASYDRALALNADCPVAHYGRSLLRLLQGDFARGWPEYEWRWKTGAQIERDFSQPRWDGRPLHERTILLFAEQGLGDSIQFVRYASLVKQQNPTATVILECYPPLMELFASCPGIDLLVPHAQELPRFDLHAPLLSVPGLLRTSLETIPAQTPYLYADPALVDHWRVKLMSVPGPRIGINWRGQVATRQRDIPVQCLKRLTQCSAASFISLQKDAASDELSAISGDEKTVIDLGPALDATHGAFMDTAAVMTNLDLVITSDTAIPHLAGALGVPVWLALPYVPDWRWFLDRADSPWYPTVRLFRQKSPSDWIDVFREIGTALEQQTQKTQKVSGTNIDSASR